MVWIYKECIEHNIIPSDGREIKREDFDRLVSMVFSNNANRVESMPVDSRGCPCVNESAMTQEQKHEA